MEEIKKYAYEEWQSKYPGEGFSAQVAVNYSNDIDEALEKCEEILNKVSLTIEYSSVKSDMEKYLLDSGVLCNYAGNIGLDIYYYIDTKLHDDFTKNATETISKINAEDIETKVIDDSEKITTNIEGVEIEEARSTLKFEDFMKENKDIGGVARNEFAKLFNMIKL